MKVLVWFEFCRKLQLFKSYIISLREFALHRPRLVQCEFNDNQRRASCSFSCDRVNSSVFAERNKFWLINKITSESKEQTFWCVVGASWPPFSLNQHEGDEQYFCGRVFQDERLTLQAVIFFNSAYSSYQNTYSLCRPIWHIHIYCLTSRNIGHVWW